jgi:glyoxylase-like metal-dependent hydrolase (beta-lactamase superfamily II)
MAIARVHHLNCGTMCPNAFALGTGGLRERGLMVCHCLLLETAHAGLILVDSGFGLGDVAASTPLHPLFRKLVSPRLDRAETAIEQVRALGFAPEDVRHIVVTHLDIDHAGGLPDCPWARVHIHRAERDAALLRRTFPERQRYVPNHFAHGPSWQAYREAGDDWFGFEAVSALDGIGEDVALIPLFGHSRGHAGIAVRTADGWLLHGGDAFFHHAELDDARQCPTGLRVFQAAVQFDGKARVANAERLRALHRDHGSEVRIICAHDPHFLAAAIE